MAKNAPTRLRHQHLPRIGPSQRAYSRSRAMDGKAQSGVTRRMRSKGLKSIVLAAGLAIAGIGYAAAPAPQAATPTTTAAPATTNAAPTTEAAPAAATPAAAAAPTDPMLV